jgi:hypothetical protein
MSIESPSYSVVLQRGPVEYRRYEPYLVAETLVENDGRYKDAGNEGFRRLFRYITGGNTAQQKIAMTAPVEQSAARADGGSRIAMTAPVSQSLASQGWLVSFMVPSAFTMDTVPQPTDPRVAIRRVPAELRAVLRYSGRWTDKLFTSKRSELLVVLAEQGVEIAGEPQSAFYDPPYKLPFMRRNEVQAIVSALPAELSHADAAGMVLGVAR